MSYFSDEFLGFLKELAANNNRDWFHANKKRYEKNVKEPFAAFVGELIARVKETDKRIEIQPKDAIFRIYRDTRFSKDKTPYKTNVSAVISPGGRKDATNLGLYIEMNPEHIRVYSGAYMLDKAQLEDIRYHIANNLEKFDKLLNEKSFKDNFGTIRGEQNKRLPKELREAGDLQNLIYNKQFYWFTELDPELATHPELPQLVMDKYHACGNMRAFIAEGLGVPA